MASLKISVFLLIFLYGFVIEASPLFENFFKTTTAPTTTTKPQDVIQVSTELIIEAFTGTENGTQASDGTTLEIGSKNLTEAEGDPEPGPEELIPEIKLTTEAEETLQIKPENLTAGIVKNIVEKTADTVKDAVKKVSVAVEDLNKRFLGNGSARNLSGFPSSIDAATKSVTNAMKKADKALNKSNKIIDVALKNTGKKLGSAMSRVLDKAAVQAKKVLLMMNETRQDLGDQIAKTKLSIGDAMHVVNDYVKEEAGKIGHTVAEGAKELGSTLSEKTSGTLDNTKNVLEVMAEVGSRAAAISSSLQQLRMSIGSVSDLFG